MHEKPLCALVIGHKRVSPGAVNAATSLDEFSFNEILAGNIVEEIGDRITVKTVYRDTYRELPDKINRLTPDFVVSLHCNAYNTQASGTEVLYYHQSLQGRRLASCLNKHLVNALELPDRGIKPKSAEDRGGYLLRYTAAPCVIAEPFFIDNDRDLSRAQDRYVYLVDAYADAIEKYAAQFS